MEFRALGPVTVHRDGDEVDLGPPGQKAVLALLLMHHGQLLSTDRIVEELWGDRSEGKLNALRVYVSRLRSALDPDRSRGAQSVLETVGSGYRLNVDSTQFDVGRFEREAADAKGLLASDPAQAAAALRSALDLWSGTAYADFADADFAHFEIARLGEARVDALEDRIEADLALGLGGELASELEQLGQQHPLRERLVESRALALYRSGRPGDALRAVDRFRLHVGEELGIDPSPRLLRLEEQILLHDDTIQPKRSAPDLQSKRPARNPFKGLRAFGTGDEGSFFGRDALIADIVRMLGRGERLIALVGASGSGKSSAIRAGLIPALAKGVVDGSQHWLVASMVPGAHPFAELDAALLRSTINGPASLSEQLGDGDAGLVGAALRILPEDDSHLLLIIDQFEELFTLVDQESERDRFLSNLVTAIDEPHGRITVVITLRADFYGHPLAHPQFGARLGSGVVNVTPFTAEELEAAALRPAQEQGVGFEPALLGQLIADVGSQPGSLPSFQYALTELFDRRDGDTLTAASYRAMGGIDGALQRRATDLFDEFDDQHRAAARQLFLRLVAVSPDGQRSRRRVAARDIASLAVDTVTMQSVIERFGTHRLLSFDADQRTGAPTVELAHEALLSAWPVLEEWIDHNRDDLRRHASLVTALREWQLAGEDPDYLLPPSRLADFDDWAQTSPLALNDDEKNYLAAGSARAEREIAEARRRQRDDARARRRLWGLVAALGAALGVAALFLLGVVGGSDPDQPVAYFGNRSENSWSANIAAGVDRAARDFGLTVTDVPWVVDPAAEFRELAETGPGIVITDGLGYSGDPQVIADFPDVQFGILDVAVSGPNAWSVSFANEEGAYLAGAAAALKTETGIIGFIGAKRVPVIEEYHAGFEAGALAVDPDVTVIASYIDQDGDMAGAGFFAPDVGADRAMALYRQGADVVFAAAGGSGAGVFDAVVEESEATGRHLWAIGVDNDQWFDVEVDQQGHVLTSIIKRGDVAAYRLLERMLEGGATSSPLRLGLAEDAFRYSLQGQALTPEMIVVLDRMADDIAAGRVDVPVATATPSLRFDAEGNPVAGAPDSGDAPAPGVDGFALLEPLEPGTLDLTALGTPLTLSLEAGWASPRNDLGHTVFTHPNSTGRGDRSVVFLRPHVLADPAEPQNFGGQPWPLDDIEGWLDQVVDGLVTAGPQSVTIGGRPAVYFEAEITDATICGPATFCAGFVANTFEPGPENGGEGTISGWPFNPGFHHRIWWVDQGAEAPLVIIAATATTDRSFQTRADALLDTLTIGDPEPHPVPFTASGLAG